MTAETDARQLAEKGQRAHLTQAMEDRRVELRMSWDVVAREAGVSVAHLRRVRSGAAALTPMVIRGIEDGLRWVPGSVQRVLVGGEPRVVTASGRPAALWVSPDRCCCLLNADEPARECPLHGEPEVMLREVTAEAERLRTALRSVHCELYEGTGTGVRERALDIADRALHGQQGDPS